MTLISVKSISFYCFLHNWHALRVGEFQWLLDLTDNWNTLLKCGNFLTTYFSHTLNIKHESSAGFCNFYHYPKEWNWYKCLFIYQSRHYFELFDQRISKTEEKSLFSSAPFEKLDQNKLFKVSTEQWCYHVCYCLENTQELPNTARAFVALGILDRNQESLTPVHSFLIHLHLACFLQTIMANVFWGLCLRFL